MNLSTLLVKLGFWCSATAVVVSPAIKQRHAAGSDNVGGRWGGGGETGCRMVGPSSPVRRS